jgi:hypothetical protein
MYKNKYIISIISLLVITLCLLYLRYYYVERRVINQILKEWDDKTDGGFIKVDDAGRYKGDYYLSINNFENTVAHIHIITKCNENDLCYVVKNHRSHSQLYFIDKNKSAGETVKEMLQNYNKFQG